MARPETPIDWHRVDELLEAGSPGTEIAGYFGVHPNTFYRRIEDKYSVSFSEYSAQKKSRGDALIREAQLKKAIKKLDNTMLIWLGKQRLGQKENAGDKVVAEDVLQAFTDLMAQLDKAQEQRKMSTTTLSTDDKSACVTASNLAPVGRESIF
jgi:hypothetical protein